MKSEVCGRCGEEVRYGTRGLTTGWLHRVDGDHVAILGRPQTPEDIAYLEAQQHVVRHLDDGTPYTTAEFDIMRDKDVARRKARLAALHGADPDWVEPWPEPEIRKTTIEVDELPARSGMRQIANLLLNSPDWGLRRLTRARGPYIGADGSVLSISDSIVIGGRGPEVDGGVAVAVGSWRDGKFDSAYAGILRDGRLETRPVNATELKSWIKESDAPDSSEGDDRQGLSESGLYPGVF